MFFVAFFAATVTAAPITTLKSDGSLVTTNDRFLPSYDAELDSVPNASATSTPKIKALAVRSVLGELKRIYRSDVLKWTWTDYQRYVKSYKKTVKTQKKLKGQRKSELGAVLTNTRNLAATGQLISSRVKPVFLILSRNREWWVKQPIPTTGQRIKFGSSKTIFQYYPGQGLQIQPLANFGRVNALWSTNKDNKELEQMLDELIPLAAQRGGGLAFEYYFHFGGGTPPWMSSLAQGTAIQALARASKRLDKAEYIKVATKALKLFQKSPPTGVRLGTPNKAHYLIYSFNSGLRVTNAFVQSLVGIYDYQEITGSKVAKKIFRAGDKQARSEVKKSDTGAWSLYSVGGAESDASYHDLLRGFLKNLCKRTKTKIYCTTAQHFRKYQKEKPRITLLTKQRRRGRLGPITFRLSKVSQVGITVSRKGRSVFSTSAHFTYGQKSFTWPVPKKTGKYRVKLTATGPTGNKGQTVGTIKVTKK